LARALSYAPCAPRPLPVVGAAELGLIPSRRTREVASFFRLGPSLPRRAPRVPWRQPPSRPRSFAGDGSLPRLPLGFGRNAANHWRCVAPGRPRNGRPGPGTWV